MRPHRAQAPVVILGAGMAGLGAALRLREAAVPFLVFDAAAAYGGHTASVRHPDGFVFDDGPHVSFTKNERVRALFTSFVDGAEWSQPARINNYWRGLWLTHPIQMHLREVPPELAVQVLTDFINLPPEPGLIANYEEWLVASFGRTFASTFPIVYGTKYHTTPPATLTTDWLGPRMYRPNLAEILEGALGVERPSRHYVTEFRYPLEGGFGSYLRSFAAMSELRLNHEAVAVDPAAREVVFGNGHRQPYRALISSLPLPVLVDRLAGVPDDVAAAAQRLSFSSVVIVNLGVARDTISDAHISYVYDEDVVFARLNFPYLLAPSTVPSGASSVQAEIYVSERYKPLEGQPAEFIPRVIADLTRIGVLREDDRILHQDAHLTRFANVIYDHDRGAALAPILAHLREVGIATCGRYGEWNHHWTDESFVSGEQAAGAVLAGLDAGLPAAR
jgi:protoporphyrinogen oxidase